MPRPYAITSLKDDFEAIGLSLKEDKETPSEDKPIDEVARIKVKRHTAGERRKWKMAKRKGAAKSKAKKYRKRAGTKRMLKKHQAKVKNLRRGNRQRFAFSGNDAVANLAEAQAILSELSEEKIGSALRAFANVAIIAELLSRSFDYFSEEDGLDDDDVSVLSEKSETYSQVAEQAAEIARALKRGDEDIDLDELAEVFRAQMKDLLDGLDLYTDITESDDDEISEGDDDESDEDEEEEDDDDDDDDEDEDDEEEEEESPPKKKNPFAKK